MTPTYNAHTRISYPTNLVNLTTDEQICYTLVYPEEDAPHAGRISVLSPMGMVLLGARVGDEVCWNSSVGPRAARVARLLYQPEAARRDGALAMT